MSDINWEPQNVAYLAEELSKIANEYRSNIAEVYKLFDKIGKDGIWEGKNYNRIVSNIMNRSRDIFQDWSDYLQYTIPEKIYIIAKMKSDEENLEFFLYQNTDEIMAVEETLEKTDGSLIIDIDAVRLIINSSISEACENAKSKLKAYITQFEELNTIDEDGAILTMYNRLEVIINKNQTILQTFQEDIQMAAEMSFKEIELTNEETIQMAEKIISIIDN